MTEPGFPARSGRLAFGPDKVIEKRLVDPRTMIDDRDSNLLFWQVGALGLIAPLAIIVYDGVSDAVTYAASTWDQLTYAVSPPWMAETKLGVGLYRFVFDANVLNKVGGTQPLAVQWAVAKTMGTAAHAFGNKRAEAEVVAASPAQIDVDVRTAAGALADQDVVLLVG